MAGRRKKNQGTSERFEKGWLGQRKSSWIWYDESAVVGCQESSHHIPPVHIPPTSMEDDGIISTCGRCPQWAVLNQNGCKKNYWLLQDILIFLTNFDDFSNSRKSEWLWKFEQSSKLVKNTKQFKRVWNCQYFCILLIWFKITWIVFWISKWF